MADIVFVAIALAFFALCVLYIRWCDIIMGPDEIARGYEPDDVSESLIEEVAA